MILVKNPDEIEELSMRKSARTHRKKVNRLIRLSRDEKHAVSHAQYQVERATDDNPECCFDCTLVQTWLDLTNRLLMAVTK